MPSSQMRRTAVPWRRRALALLPVMLFLVACGGDEDTGPTGKPGGAGPTHVHGLGINPADGDLYIATHAGLLRSSEGTTSVERVGESERDTMGFTVVGPDHFLASGHPGPGETGPPNLGLIESTDGGQTWTQVSLAGEADFHVLRFAHDRVYAFNGLTGELMLSDDGGESWSSRELPGAVIDLAVDPHDADRMIAATERGLALSEDRGRDWRLLGGPIGLLAWPRTKALYLVDARGRVQVSSDVGKGWEPAGDIGGQPAALAAVDDRVLYAALADGTVLASTDGGESWGVRASP